MADFIKLHSDKDLRYNPIAKVTAPQISYQNEDFEHLREIEKFTVKFTDYEFVIDFSR